MLIVVSVQLLGCIWLFVTPWTAACQASLSFSISRSLLKFMSTEWCHPTISSSVTPFSSCPQSFPASGSFPMSQFLESDGQSIEASASASVLPMNIQCWFPLGLTGLNSLLPNRLTRVFSSTTVWSISSVLQHSAFFVVQLSHPYMTTGKTIALTIWTSVGKVMSLIFNTLCHSFSSKKQASFNFMTVVTNCSDFGATRK